MDVEWQLREAGPPDAEQTVLLLPGGMCSAGSYAEVMAEPALADLRLVAATLPGHTGAPPPSDYSVETTPGSLRSWRTRSAPMSRSGSAWVRPSRPRCSPPVASPGRPSCSASVCRRTT